MFQTQIGAFCVHVIEAGCLALDGGAMFGVVPKVVWEKLAPPDAQNRIQLALNCPVIDWTSPTGAHRRFLLDTGVGTKFSEKHVAMYGFSGPFSIRQALETHGIDPDSITDVLLTHLHFDHAGGATQLDESGQLMPTFPQAQHWIHKKEWEVAMAPGPKSKASYLADNFAPLIEAGLVTWVEADSNPVVPGMWLEVTGGHTAFHQILRLESQGEGLIYWADLIPMRHHLKIPYVMAYDLYPTVSMEQKALWLARAFAGNWVNLFEHDPDVPACRLSYNETKSVYEASPLAGLADGLSV